MNFYLIIDIDNDDDDNDNDGSSKEEEEQQEVLPSKENWVGYKTKLPPRYNFCHGRKA